MNTTWRFRSHVALGAVTLLLTTALLHGCGGTKVYETSKTVVYRGSLYNITNTQQITSKTEGRTKDGEVIDLAGVDRKRFESLLDEHDELRVRMVFGFDEQELVYRTAPVDSWRDFSAMQRDFERAGEDIADLMKDRKDTQVELR